MAQTPCKFVNEGLRVTHTFSADAKAGEVVEIGTVPMIVAAAVDYSEQPIGELCVAGVFDVPQVAGIITAGDPVYWDNNGSPYGGTALSGCATGTASGNTLMGLAAPTQPNGLTATTATDSYVRVILTAPTTEAGPVNFTPGASTAAAGSTVADAGALPAGTSRVYPTTAADDTKGVVIDVADKVTGRMLFIGNGVSNKILKVYGPSGASINGAAGDAAFSSVSGKGVIIVCLSSGGNTWLAW